MSEIARLTQKLTASSSAERRRAAAGELRDLGFARRQSLEKRGTLGEAAQGDLPQQEIDVLHALLEDEDPAVRRYTILALGDLGDARSVPALLEHVHTTDLEIKLAAIDSLGDIGGREGVAALSAVASDVREDRDVRFAALSALEELAAKQITSGPDRRFDPPDDLARAMRGLDRPPGADDATAGLARAAGKIEADASAEDMLRLKASDVRAYLASDLQE
jgi:HEAT repeat protein